MNNRERFEKNGNTKLTNAAVAIRRLAQLGNKKSYEATPQELKFIIKELRKEVALVEEEFNKGDYFK
jgi:hypothetical protein